MTCPGCHGRGRIRRGHGFVNCRHCTGYGQVRDAAEAARITKLISEGVEA